MGEILFMGPKGSGKTLLLRRLQTLQDEKRLSPFDPIHRTTPTDATESCPFKLRQGNYVFKELGGAIIKDWLSYAAAPVGIVFVFDGADLTKTAANVVWLNELLNEASLEEKPILIALAKCDVPDCVRFTVIDEIIGLDRVLKPSRLTFLETSSVVGIGLRGILDWIPGGTPS
jgi:GTPase SAR1 family protein